MTTALDIDMYQASMLRGYFENGMHEHQGSMEAFARKLPLCRDFFLVAGIGRIVDYLNSVSFSDEDIRILRSIPGLQIPEGSDGDAFCNYLANIDFKRDLKLFSMPEGTIAFPHEPILRIEGPIGLCQYVEKRILSIINHDIRVASKAARVVLAAQGRPVFEFGGRRAHEECSPDTARAAYIAGFAGTSNVQAFAEYGVPAIGTMGHVWIMSHETEREAFENWSKAFKNSVYLVDTYNTYDGIDAAAVYARGNIGGIRLDSGDLAHLASSGRRVLNRSAGIDVKIVASNDLDEYSIADLLQRGAAIDSFGVGTQLVSTPDSASLGFVYKLVAVGYHNGDVLNPICKIADGGKGTWPGQKQIFRYQTSFQGNTVITNDVVGLLGEELPGAEAMLKPHIISSVDHYEYTLAARQRFMQCLKQMPPYLKTIPRQPIANTQRMEYPVDFSDKLSQLRQQINSK